MKQWLLLLTLTLTFATNLVAAEKFTEGADYAVISPAVNTGHDDKVVVKEIFWYGCPHCFRFEPFVDQWLKTKPENVIFELQPSVLNPPWSDHARTFFALELMGETDKVHQKLFNAIHVDKQRLTSQETIAKFVAKLGVDEKQFRENFYSFPVDSKLRKSRQIEQKYGHRGVPAVIINGKYRTGGSMAGSYTRMLKIVDFLVAKELAEMKK